MKMKQAESIEIVSLVDNSADFISSVQRKEAQTFRHWTKTRYGSDWEKESKLPIAEHGFSMALRVRSRGKSHLILFDTGGSSNIIIQNSKCMGLNLAEIETVVLSHGHYDHSGGLLSVLKASKKTQLPVIVHGDMFRIRGVANSDGTIREYLKFPNKRQLKSAKLIETRQPNLIADDLVLVTGEIPRKTTFEKGYLEHRYFEKGIWQPDPHIMDDRAIVINAREKGLVVIAGCAHAGIINTIQYAQRITGVEKIYVAIGGFHLAGEKYESRIKDTLKELTKINPELLIPAHCTGWKGMCAMSKAMPDAFIWNSVGNRYEL